MMVRTADPISLQALTDYRVISIGTLAAHPLWGEDKRAAVRTGHATTTLVCTDTARVLVDPSLPAPALLARLGERTKVRAAEISHVFLTSADRLHHRGLVAFENAVWLAHETELDAARTSVREQIAETADSGDDELDAALKHELATLERCEPAPDSIAPGIDLFPLPGVSPGCCGLLLPMPRATVLICGDAVATAEHLEEGKVLPDSFNVEQARESFAEAIQIADLLIPGRDNISVNPLRPPFGA